MSSLGNLYFALGLDDSKFNEAIDAAKQRIEKLGANVSLNVDTDTQKVVEQVRKTVENLNSNNKVEINAEVNTKDIETTIERCKVSISQLNKLLEQSYKEKAHLEEEYSKSEGSSKITARQSLSDVEYRIKEQEKRLGEVKRELADAEQQFASISSSKNAIGDIVDTKDIEEVKALTSATKDLNTQLEVSKRLSGLSTDKSKQISQNASTKEALKVEVDKESITSVEKQLKKLGQPIDVKISLEYDIDKFKAVETAFRNYTKNLSSIGTIKLGIDDSFLTSGTSSSYEKGVKGFLNKTSNYLFGEDSGAATKSVQTIQKVLDSHPFKIKVTFDQQSLIETINKKTNKIAVKVDADVADLQKKLKSLKIPLGFNISQAISEVKTELKKKSFEAKLNLVIDKAKISEVIKAAFAKKGLEYNATPSDVRNTRILEIQQKMLLRQNKFNESLNRSVQHTGKLSSGLSKATDWASQLSKQIGNAFSIYSIERFLRSLYTVGGEFQKQRIALRGMIGDEVKADKLYGDVKTMAVKSPFTFSELASYTKQLSAYGIEYGEIYDTTKRLADISAGVGVDMSRLILAFGQVRSAAVLRGQELRQFTEAGIPLVQALADKFTKLNGEVVTTGDVFDLISKRQVSFEMVRDILFEMTEEGNRFFNMQEELAESLAGKWSNLKDSYDIMLSEMAEGNNAFLGGLIEMITDMMRSWESLAAVLGTVVAAYGAYKAVLVLTAAYQRMNTALTIADTAANLTHSKAVLLRARNMGILTNAQTKALLSSNKLMRVLGVIGVNPYALAIAGVAALGVAIYSAYQNATKLERELNEISNKTITSTSSLVSGLDILVNKLSEATKGTKEYDDIIKQINTRYGQYLPNLIAEADSYDAIAQKAREAKDAIYEKAKADNYEKQSSKITEAYEVEQQSNIDDLIDHLMDKQINGNPISKALATEITSHIVNLVNKGFSYGDIVDNIKEMYSLDLSVPSDASIYEKYVKGSKLIIKEIMYTSSRLKIGLEEARAVSNALFGDTSIGIYSEELKEIEDRYNELKDKSSSNIVSQTSLEIEKLNEQMAILKKYGQENTTQFSTLAQKARDLQESLTGWKAKLTEALGKDNPLVLKLNSAKTFEEFQNIAEEAYEEAKKVIEKNKNLFTTLGLDIDTATPEDIDNKTSNYPWLNKALKDTLKKKAYMEAVEAANRDLLTNISTGKEVTSGGNNTPEDTWLKEWKARLDLVKKFHSEYKKYADLIGEEAAKERIKGSEAFGSLATLGITDPSKQKENLDILYQEISKVKPTLERTKAKNDLKVEMSLNVDYEAMKEQLAQAAKIAKKELDRMGKEWNMYKSWFNATGDKRLSMNIAFGGVVSYKDQVDEMMSNLQKEVDKWNKTYGTSFDYKSLINEDIDELNSLFGQDNAIVSYIQSIKDESNKLKDENLNTLLEIIKNNKTFSQQLEDIERKRVENIRKINENKDIPQYQKDKAIEAVNKNADKDSAKVSFNEFKESSDWIKVFDDLDRVSTATLDKMIQKVEKFSSEITGSEEVTKQLVEAMRKLRKELIERDPFKVISNALKDLKELKRIKSTGTLVADGTQYRTGSGTEDDPFVFTSANKVNNEIRLNLNLLKESSLVIADKFKFAGEAAEFLGTALKNGGLLDGISDMANSVGGGIQTGATLGGGLGAVIGAVVGLVQYSYSLDKKAYEYEMKMSQERMKLIQNVANILEDTVKSSAGGIYTMELSKATKETFSRFIEGYDLYLKYKDVYWTAQAGPRPGTGFEYLSEDTISAMQKAIDEDSYYMAQLASLRLQRDELNKQIKSSGGKDSDETEIQDKKFELENIEREIKNLSRDIMETLYSVDFKDWAQQFTDSIVEAWARGEDAAEAYKRTVADVMRNVAASVIQQGIIGKWLEENMSKVLDLFEKNDGKMTDEVYSALGDLALGLSGKVEETKVFLDAWEEILNEKGLTMKDIDEDDTMSKTIQGVTEDTANLLASYLNAVRQDVSVKRTLIEKFVNDDVPKISYIAEAQLIQLQIVATNTKRNADAADKIYDLVNRVVDKGNNKLKI